MGILHVPHFGTNSCCPIGCPLLFVGAKTQANYRLGVPRRVVTCTFQFTMQRVSEWLENENAYLADGWTKSLTVCLVAIVALGNPIYFRIEEPFKLWTMQEFNTSRKSTNSPQFLGLVPLKNLIHANQCHFFLKWIKQFIKLFIKALVKTFLGTKWLLEWGHGTSDFGAKNQPGLPLIFVLLGRSPRESQPRGHLVYLGIRPYQEINQQMVDMSKQKNNDSYWLVAMSRCCQLIAGLYPGE